MRHLIAPAAVFAACAALAPSARAQENAVAADFRLEGEALQKACSSFSFSAIGSCAYTLFTDHPMHIAVGSIAPQNGFGFGPAFVAHYDQTPPPPTRPGQATHFWRLSWDVDGIVSTNASWRAGAYMTAILARHRGIVVKPGGPSSGSKTSSNLAVEEYPVFHVIAQGISLNTLGYFGLGPNTSDTARTYYGMTQAIAGGNVTWPVYQKLHLSLYGEANGRFVSLRPATGQSSPSIGQVYSEATAPGLAQQPGFAQFGEGVRLAPEFAGGHIRLNYLVTFKEYAAANSTYSFERWTTDLSHEFPIYLSTRRFNLPGPNGPDDCSPDPAAHACPAVTRNREGSISLRFLMNQSFNGAGHVVPFYFQPTLGGSDIDGNTFLPSYQDYRFRAPNNILAEARFEHSIYGPLGFTALIDEGKVALQRGDLDFTHLRHSYAVGLTLRAGGFPMVSLMFSWGGHEGTHTIAALNTSLLGASARPSLY